MMRDRFRIVVGLFSAGLLWAAFGASPALANDAPVCQDLEVTVTSGLAVNFQADCTDPDEGPEPLTYVLVPGSGPTKGEVFGDPSTGAATYFSFPDQSGDDSFQYRASDGLAVSNDATVTIHINSTEGNQPPICPTQTVFVQSDDPDGVVIEGGCVDPEGDPVSYGIHSWPTGGSLNIVSLSSVRYRPCTGPGEPEDVLVPDPEGGSNPCTSATTSDSFSYTATDNVHPQLVVPINITVTGSGAGTFETAPEATPDDPYVASVTTTQSGAVQISTREVTVPPPDGFFLLNQEFNISAPDGTVEEPLRLTFTIDASQVPPDPVVVFRNGTPVADCTGAPSAVPDPCVADVTTEGDGDLRITVLSSQASVWNFGVAAGGGGAYDFSGFFPPVDNPRTLNVAKAGSAIPVKFSLGGDEGLDVFAEGYPKSQAIDCDSAADTDAIESTASANANALSYDPSTDTYTYVWKTSKGWAGTCRRLVLEFDDSAGTTQRANVRFK